MERIVDIDSTLSELNQVANSNTYFLDFMYTKSFEAGILRLNPGQKDTQGPHLEDELYVVMQGEGFINILDKNHKIKKGSCIYVPSKTKHYFHGNKNQLVILYIFNVSNNHNA